LHCAETDGPIAALLDDLKASGLLETTLVVWEGSSTLAGRGKRQGSAIIIQRVSRCGWPAAESKAGLPTAPTDEFGYHVVEDKVTVPDLHATILHQLGLNHEQLTYHHQGRRLPADRCERGCRESVAGLMRHDLFNASRRDDGVHSGGRGDSAGPARLFRIESTPGARGPIATNATAPSQAKRRAGLLLDTRAALLKGGDNGPSFTAGEPEKSRLIEAIRWSIPS